MDNEDTDGWSTDQTHSSATIDFCVICPNRSKCFAILDKSFFDVNRSFIHGNQGAFSRIKYKLKR
uniref:Uncharacterized protein n=1 Tax=Romanomermis culicivorax TaxID=13658 RepID=A0A915JJ52_ROMCU